VRKYVTQEIRDFVSLLRPAEGPASAARRPYHRISVVTPSFNQAQFLALGSLLYLGRVGEVSSRLPELLASARERGVGETLVRACVARAKSSGAVRLVLSTDLEMRAAQRLYERLGFVRTVERDWTPVAGLELITYELELHASELEA